MRPMTAQDRFRSAYDRRIEIALGAALALHLVAIQFSPYRVTPGPRAEPQAAMQLIDLPEPATEYRIVTPREPRRPSLATPTFALLPANDTDLPPLPDPAPIDPFPSGSGIGAGPGDPPFTWWDQQPLAVKRVHPEYPTIAREARAEGNVIVEVRIDTRGRVLSARVVSSTTVPALEEAARRAALGWLFRPARQRDQAVPAVLHIPFRFRLGS